MLDRPRPHHYELAHRALPSLMGPNPEHVIETLRSDSALAFLEHIGGVVCERLERAGAIPPPNCFAGLAVHQVEAAGLPVVLVRMPPALAPAEAIFVALFVTAEGEGRVHTLELSVNVMTGDPTTMACEWRDGTHMNHGQGPEGSVEAYRAWLDGFLSDRVPD